MIFMTLAQCSLSCVELGDFSDGPFDLEKGLGFFLMTSYFFLLLYSTSFKSKQKYFFLEINTLKSEKCK